jgi:hypothetical protein
VFVLAYQKYNINLRMSRLSRYKESLARFIKDRSCLSEPDYLPNNDIYPIIYNHVKDSDLILPTMLLTIMHNQNKKHKVSVQGYYAATGIEFLHIMINIIMDYNTFKEKYGLETYIKTVNFLILCFHKSISQNLESINNSKNNNKKFASIFTRVLSICNNKLSYKHLLKSPNFEYNNKSPKTDTLRWYLSDNSPVSKEFKKINQIKRTSLVEYINDSIGCICEIAFCIGWYIGFGEKRYIKKISKLARHFTMLYKIAKDFEVIENDILHHNNGISVNYVVNYGLQSSYEDYLHHKQKFIEGVMTLDIYTNTIKEIVNSIDQKVDYIIDQTSPDLKSYCSTTPNN